MLLSLPRFAEMVPAQTIPGGDRERGGKVQYETEVPRITPVGRIHQIRAADNWEESE